MNFSKFPTTGTRHRLLGLAIAQAIGGLYAPVTRAGSINAGNRVTVGSTSDLSGDILCSLRDAIAAVKSGNPVGGCSPTLTVGVDRINFNIPVTPATISLQNGSLIVDSSVSIRGPGPDQLTLINDNEQVIRNLARSSLGLSGLTIAGSQDSCLRNESLGTLTLTNMVVRDCAGEDGAGVFNEGSLEVNNSTFTLNTASGSGGAVFNEVGSTTTIRDSDISRNSAVQFGGGISNAGSLEIAGGVIELNTADIGPGIATSGNFVVTISGATIRSNSYGYSGAALYSQGMGTVTLSSVTLSGNSALNGAAILAKGGLIQIVESTISANSGSTSVIQVDSPAEVRLTRSLITDNAASFLLYARNGGVLTLNNATISNNNQSDEIVRLQSSLATRSRVILVSSTVTANTISQSAGAILGVRDGATLEVSNSIVAGHNGYDCVADSGAVIAVNNNNIFETGNCSQNAADNIIADPQLSPLADNGGPTLTHALLPTSPAIDAGETNCDPSDQRGFARDDGQCDIGAFEFGGVTPDQVFRDGFEN